jgi:hypothetical protein
MGRRTGLRLWFIYRRRRPSQLVAEGRLNSKGRAVASKSKTGRGVATVPIFLLVPQVKLRKRLDLARDAERAVHGVPGRSRWRGKKGRHQNRGLLPVPKHSELAATHGVVRLAAQCTIPWRSSRWSRGGTKLCNQILLAFQAIFLFGCR